MFQQRLKRNMLTCLYLIVSIVWLDMYQKSSKLARILCILFPDLANSNIFT